MKRLLRMMTIALSFLMLPPVTPASCVGTTETGEPDTEPQGTEPLPETDAPGTETEAAGTDAPETVTPDETAPGAETETEDVNVTQTETEAETQPAAPDVTWERTDGALTDYVLHVASGKKTFRILQLTDLQTIYLKGAAKGTLRAVQLSNAFFTDGVKDRNVRVYNYVRRAVAEAQPDLIILTGDNVYGETDDSGILWDEMIDLMNELGLPWGFVFGNHDNESMKGVRWQIEEAAARSPLLLFARGDERGMAHGNSNYSILLEQDGKSVFQLFMLDTNGCKEIDNPGEGLDPENPDYDVITQQAGIRADQRGWFRTTALGVSEAAGETVPSLLFFHIPLLQVRYELEGRSPDASYPLTPDGEGEFGVAATRPAGIDANGDFWAVMKEVGSIGAFFGHRHRDCASILSEGIRLTYGLKASTDAEYDKTALGSTLITLDLGTRGMTVEHLYQTYTKEKMP